MRLRAFTLVEILVVLAILVVVAGILFPVVGAARRRAVHTACADRLKQLGVADALYANDHDGWVPPATTAENVYTQIPGSAKPEVLASPAVLRAAMQPYVKNEVVWFCPADPKAGQDVLWLGQRHRLTSYRFLVGNVEDGETWPPRMQLGRDPSSRKPDEAKDFPLILDASCTPECDSPPPYRPNPVGESNHQDQTANVLRQDLSLARLPTSELFKPWGQLLP